MRFFIPDVKSPAIIRIKPCPSANKNSIKTAAHKFFPIAANAIIPAKIGVEQGVPARAKAIPRSTGYKNNELVEFVGIAFIITGMSNSNKLVSFNPITSKSDAIISVKYPPRVEANTLPVTAQIIPITENTIAVPSIKQKSCIKVLKGVSLEYPPTYPIISGSIASEHGEIDARTPPAKEAANISIQTPIPVEFVEKICARLSIIRYLF